MKRRSNWQEERAELRARAVELCPHVDNPGDTADGAVVDALYLADAVRQLDSREVWGLLALWRTEDPVRLFAATVALAAMVPPDRSVSELLAWTDSLAQIDDSRSAA